MALTGRDLDTMLDILSGSSRPTRPMGGVAETARLLKENLAAYREHHVFAEGDLVTWKPNLKNRKIPEYGEPIIVHEIINEVSMKDDSGTAYYKEPLTLKCGVRKVDADGENYLVYQFDGSRMMPFTEK